MFAIILALLAANLKCGDFEDDEYDGFEDEFDRMEEADGNNVAYPKNMNELREILDSNDRVVIYFYQYGCPSCLRIKSFWESKTKNWNFTHKKVVKFVEVELPITKEERVGSEFFAFATKLGSQTRPFFAFYKEDKFVFKYQGSNDEHLEKCLSQI